MTWGQFLDHDITLTEVEEAECGTNDEVCPIRPECIGINILPGDELEVNQTFKCIPTPRSFRDKNGEQVSWLHFVFFYQQPSFIKIKNFIGNQVYLTINSHYSTSARCIWDDR